MASAILRRLCPGAPSHFCRSFSVTARRRDVYTVQDADDFEERVLQVKEVPVIIDFYADWCAPCRLLVDRLEKVIVPKGDKVHLAKVNVDELTDIAMDYNVSAVPHIIAYKDGKILDRFVGLKDEDQIELFVERAMDS